MTAYLRGLGIIITLNLFAFAIGAKMDASYADTRVALVVGNSNYRNIARLPNPESDAKLMAETLRGLGFKLVNGGAQVDLDKQQFDRAVQDFGNAVQGADVALFYYAGHGMQVHGSNYLVPVGANPTKESDIDFQMLDTNLLLRVLESAGARLNLVILDACRNNPFQVSRLRAARSGLAQMQAPEGTLISFATQPGNVAADGDGGHSPYTDALAKTLRKPGLDIFRTFNEVGLVVSNVTGGEQQPWLSVSPIKGDFYFAGAPKPAQPKPDPVADQKSNYEAAERVGTPEAWQSFLNAYPQGYLADLARAQHDKIVARERAQQHTAAAAAEQSRKEAEAKAAREASEKATREAAEKAAAADRARNAAETRAARDAAEKARKAAALEKAKREAEAKDAQAALETATREAEAAREAKQAAEQAAQEAIASLQKERAAREEQLKVAALQSPTGEIDHSPPRIIIDPSDVVRLVKIHLQQVGCDPGSVDGVWDEKGRLALAEFNKHAGTKLDVKTVNVNTLDSVRAINKRICPLVCGRGTRLEGDHCVAITCKSGFVPTSQGTCKAVAKHPKDRAHTKTNRDAKSPSGKIILGSSQHLSLASSCKNGNVSACQTLCNAGGQRACTLGGGGRRGRANNGRVPVR